MNEDHSIQLALDIEIEEPSKYCPECQARKVLSEFNRDRTSLDGGFRMCRPCSNAWSSSYNTWFLREHGTDPKSAWRAAQKAAEEAAVIKTDLLQFDFLEEAA